MLNYDLLKLLGLIGFWFSFWVPRSHSNGYMALGILYGDMSALDISHKNIPIFLCSFSLITFVNSRILAWNCFSSLVTSGHVVHDTACVGKWKRQVGRVRAYIKQFHGSLLLYSLLLWTSFVLLYISISIYNLYQEGLFNLFSISRKKEQNCIYRYYTWSDI